MKMLAKQSLKDNSTLNDLILLLLFLIILAACTSTPPKPKTDLEKLHLIGSVKQVTETQFDKLTIRNELPEDDPKFEIFQKEITKFNTEGNIVESQTILFTLPDSLSNSNKDRLIYKYDDNGYLLYYYNTFDTSNKKRFIYDKKGNLIKNQWHINSNPSNNKTEYKYDQDNHLLEETEWDTTSTPISKKTHLYNKQGKKIETSLYKRNKSGKLQFDVKNLYKYDSTGSIIEVTTFYRNELSRKTLYKYDSLGNTILTTQLDANVQTQKRDSIIYQFDHKNNWIKKTTYSATLPFIEPKPYEITQRIIEYY